MSHRPHNRRPRVGELMSTLLTECTIMAVGLWYWQALATDIEHNCILSMAISMHKNTLVRSWGTLWGPFFSRYLWPTDAYLYSQSCVNLFKLDWFPHMNCNSVNQWNCCMLRLYFCSVHYILRYTYLYLLIAKINKCRALYGANFDSVKNPRGSDQRVLYRTFKGSIYEATDRTFVQVHIGSRVENRDAHNLEYLISVN